MLDGTAVGDVVKLGHDVVGALDKVPDEEEVAGWGGRGPGRVRLESLDEVREAGSDYFTNLRGGDGGRGGGRVEERGEHDGGGGGGDGDGDDERFT